MIYKFDLIISGENLFPEKILNSIQNDVIINYVNTPDDTSKDKGDSCDLGTISFWHPKKFAHKENIISYEKWFVDFLSDNYNLLSNSGAEDFTLYMEIYYDGIQCNFEIFNKYLLSQLVTYNVSIPISVYALEATKFRDWEKEIALEWNKL